MLCKLGWGWLEIKGQMWLVPALFFFCPANACRNDVTLGLALITRQFHNHTGVRVVPVWRLSDARRNKANLKVIQYSRGVKYGPSLRLIDARNGAESVPDLRLGEAKVISVRVGNVGYWAM